MSVTIIPVFVYVVHDNYSPVVSVFSTLEKAKSWVDDEQYKVIEDWRNFATDMADVETWELQVKLCDDRNVSIIITKYPVNRTPKDLAGY